jgi:NCS1 family nucleobase:cation symporter-1
VADLYRRGGEYEYANGVNPKALVSLGLGVLVALVGLAVPALRFLYDYAWFVGFFVSALVYTMLMGRQEPLETVGTRGAVRHVEAGD